MTKKEARQFAAELEAAVEGGPAALARVMRLREVYERSVADLGLTPAFLADFKSTFDQAALGLANEFTDQIAAGGRYDLVRVRTRDGQPSVLFRLIQPTGGMNYHEYPLVRYPDGVGPADLHVLATGEPVSAGSRRGMIQGMAEADRGLFDRLTGVERLFIDNRSKIESITANRRAGRPVLVLAAFRTLPASLQADKGLLMNALTAAAQTSSDRDYLELLEQFQDAYPGDPALDWLNMDYHFVRKEYSKALAAVDRLDERLGGDPYLDMMRAALHSRSGRPAEARGAAERLVAWAPELEWGYHAGALAAAEAGDHPGVRDWCQRGVTAGALTLKPVRTDKPFAAFRRSPQFAELERWVGQRAKTNRPAARGG